MKAKSKKFKFQGHLWLYSGSAAWHFVTLGEELSQRVRTFVAGDTSAWGSIKVIVRVKGVSWETSIFPDRKIGSYLLPVRRDVRMKLKLSPESRVEGWLSVTRSGDCFD